MYDMKNTNNSAPMAAPNVRVMEISRNGVEHPRIRKADAAPPGSENT